MTSDQADSFPLSFAQEQLWLVDRLAPGAGLYNEDFAFRVNGELSVSALDTALTEVVRRHPILRTVRRTYGGTVRQQVLPPPGHVLEPTADFTGSEPAMLRWAQQVAERPFDPANDIPVRYALARLAPDEHVFVMVHHHSVSDLAAFQVLVDEIGHVYNAGIDGETEETGYFTFAQWQRELVGSGRLDAQTARWAEELADAPVVLDLSQRQRPPVKSVHGASLLIPFADDLEARLRRCAARHRATPFHILLAAFATVLHRRTRQADLVFGTGDSGRPEGYEDTIGLFARMVPVRSRVEPGERFPTTLARLRDLTLDAGERQLIPFGALVNRLLPGRDPSRPALVQVTFNLAALTTDPDVLAHCTLRRQHVPRGRSRFDLSVNIEWGDTIAAAVEYDRELFTADEVTGLIEAYRDVLDEVTADAEPPETLPGPLAYHATPTAVAPAVESPSTDGPLQRLVADCYRVVLKVPSVDVDDDFFALGGHSLAATALTDRIRDEIGVEVPLLAVFENSVVGELAADIGARHPDLVEVLEQMETLTDDEAALLAEANDVPEPKVPSGDFDGLTPPEQSFWLVEWLYPETPMNVPTVGLRYRGRIDVPALEWAVNELVDRHEILRTAFRFDERTSSPRRQVVEPPPVRVEALDLSDRPDELARYEQAQAGRGFDIAQPPLVRATVVQLSPHEFELLLSVHHIVVDKWAMAQVFLPELAALYKARIEGTTPDLPRAVGFQEAVARQLAWGRGSQAAAERAYWRERLDGMGRLDLPTDFPRPPETTYTGGEVRRWIDAEGLRTVRAASTARRMTPFMQFIAALADTLHAWSGDDDIQIMTPCDGQVHVDGAEALGCRVKMLLLRLDCAGADTPDEVAARAREAVLGAFAHRHIPLDEVLRELGQSWLTELERGAYVLLNYIQGEHDLPLAGCESVSSQVVTTETYGCDLDVYVTEYPDGFKLQVRYRDALWERQTVEAFAAQLEQRLLDLGRTGPVAVGTS
jgi:acyl carrier protein